MFIMLMYCFIGVHLFWVEYLSLSLKIGSSIKQRFCSLEATILLPSLSARSMWQVFWMRVQSCISVLCIVPIYYSFASTHTAVRLGKGPQIRVE